MGTRTQPLEIKYREFLRHSGRYLAMDRDLILIRPNGKSIYLRVINEVDSPDVIYWEDGTKTILPIDQGL